MLPRQLICMIPALSLIHAIAKMGEKPSATEPVTTTHKAVVADPAQPAMAVTITMR